MVMMMMMMMSYVTQHSNCIPCVSSNLHFILFICRIEWYALKKSSLTSSSFFHIIFFAVLQVLVSTPTPSCAPSSKPGMSASTNPCPPLPSAAFPSSPLPTSSKSHTPKFGTTWKRMGRKRGGSKVDEMEVNCRVKKKAQKGTEEISR